MAYEKQTWQTGDVITQEKLNHMEDGIAGAGGGSVLVVNVNEDASTESRILDKTWAEIQEAMVSHGVVARMTLLGGADVYSPVMIGLDSNGLYSVTILNITFTTVSIDGYPQYDPVTPT